jgi:4-hydroxy-3-polyprenylbenzoate decarboxylase
MNTCLQGFLRKKKVELVKCITQPEIEVPADADFIIEGYVDPDDEMIWEGPFGDHTGYYSLPDWYPRFHITCITHKKNPVYRQQLSEYRRRKMRGWAKPLNGFFWRLLK